MADVGKDESVTSLVMQTSSGQGIDDEVVSGTLDDDKISEETVAGLLMMLLMSGDDGREEVAKGKVVVYIGRLASESSNEAGVELGVSIENGVDNAVSCCGDNVAWVEVKVESRLLSD